jgi:HD-GYP domain-containing protein (c-di-GMP phosphodiesterase class II)
VAKEEQGKPLRISIFVILSVLLVLLVVVPLVSFSVKSVNTSKEYISVSLREQQLKTAIPAAAHIKNLMDQNQSRLVDLVAAFEIYANEPNYKTAYENLLQLNILSRYLSEDTLLLVYQDSEGGQFAAPWKGLTQNEQGILTAQVAPLGRQALATGTPQVSQVAFVRLAASGGLPAPAISIAQPVRAEGGVRATVTGVFLLTAVQRSLREYGREFTLFITDERGRLIFSSDPAMSAESQDLSQDPAVNPIMQGSFPASSMNYVARKYAEGKDLTLLVTCAPISSYRWLLFAQVDQEKYYAPIVALKEQFILWMLVSILSALVVGLLLARVITKPIVKLAHVSTELARGNFSNRADIRSRTEIGELAEAFNTMADEIQEYITKVEAAAKETQQLFMDSIRAIAAALDAKDPYTRGHSERVSAYAMIVSRQYGLDERQLRIMEISSLLHDVGKIGIEDKILRKPGALTNEEFTIMKTHPPKGAEILGSIPQMREIIPGIRHHHEKWSGGGYPDGLKGEQIPIIARIIGVADAFDAMTTNRPYQRAMSMAQAAARINELTPAVYDVRVTEAFNAAFQKGYFKPFEQRQAEAKPA